MLHVHMVQGIKLGLKEKPQLDFCLQLFLYFLKFFVNLNSLILKFGLLLFHLIVLMLNFFHFLLQLCIFEQKVLGELFDPILQISVSIKMSLLDLLSDQLIISLACIFKENLVNSPDVRLDRSFALTDVLGAVFQKVEETNWICEKSPINSVHHFKTHTVVGQLDSVYLVAAERILMFRSLENAWKIESFGID